MCFDIAQLSRIAVQVHEPMPGINLLSPLKAGPNGTSHGSIFLLLCSEHIVLSLDATCPSPVIGGMSAGHNQKILMVTAQFLECWLSLLQRQGDIIRAAEEIMKMTRSRRKRTIPENGDGIVGDNDDDDEMVL
jgi:hypothetical protein